MVGTSLDRCGSCSRCDASGRALLSLHERADAAGETKNARAAFALDLLGGEPERRNTTVHRQALAGFGSIEGRRDAKDLAPPFAERDGEAAFAAELGVGQGAPRDHVGLVRTLRLHA